MKLKLSLISLCSLILLLINPQKIFAQENFKIDYKSTYEIEESGNTKVNTYVNLTNKTVKNFATIYEMFLGFENITDLKASDVSGNIKVQLEKTENGYKAILPLNRKAVGVGGRTTINITFNTSSVARKVGQIWSVNIPGITNSDEFETMQVDIKHPKSFGNPAYIKPEHIGSTLSFDKATLGNSGISLGFGKEQIYNFDLTYHLKNPNLYKKKYTIALLSDTNYQRIFFDEIKPRPEKISSDMDGNWLAEYTLKPAENIEIKALGKSTVSLGPKTSEITAKEIELYTKPTKYWQSEDPKIQSISKNLKTPEKIYEYVVNTLKYDYKKISSENLRLGAKGALEKPASSVCREFTDLFIALARASNIPSREINGFAYTQNSKDRPLSLTQDILHSWPEYYDFDKKAWIMIDPTWGATTKGVDYFNQLDFDHLAFVVKGEDDSYPIPAGGYKSGKKHDKKDVEINFESSTISSKENFHILSTPPSKSIAGLPVKFKVEIKNTGLNALTPAPLTISSSKLSPKNQISNIPLIPPLGSYIVEAKFDNSGILTKNNGSFTIRFKEKNIEKKVKIVPFFLFLWN